MCKHLPGVRRQLWGDRDIAKGLPVLHPLLHPPSTWDLLLSFSSVLETELNYGYFNVH